MLRQKTLKVKNENGIRLLDVKDLRRQILSLIYNAI